MNKMHSLAKIVLVGLALYMAFYLCTTVIMIPFALLSGARHESSILSIVSFLFICLCLVASIYVLIYSRDKWAEKIVGTVELPNPDAQIQWVPVAFRLVAVSAGLFCLYRLVIRIIWEVQRYLMAKGTPFVYRAKIFTVEQILVWLIELAVGIYLLYGAPHFVRWQVKKTLKHCNQSTIDNSI